MCPISLTHFVWLQKLKMLMLIFGCCGYAVYFCHELWQHGYRLLTSLWVKSSVLIQWMDCIMEWWCSGWRHDLSTRVSRCGVCTICRSGDCVWSRSESRHCWTAVQFHYCYQGRRSRSADQLWLRLASETVSSRFTSSTTSQLISVIIPTLVIHHFFTLSLQAQNLLFQQILPTVDFFYLLYCLTITGMDRNYHAHHFIFSFTFYCFVYSVW